MNSEIEPVIEVDLLEVFCYCTHRYRYQKNTNQDSLLVLKAIYKNSEIVFSVLCDGMGGLAKGEVASASVIDAYSKWFQNDFIEMLRKGLDKDEIFGVWEKIASEMNAKISAYGEKNGISLGTTLVMMLMCDEKYYIMNIGDSRVYRYTDATYILTKDHTLVQREIDMGRMTEEEAKNHPKRNVLLQCIGASPFIQPDFFYGDIKSEEVYLLCSDGFRHIITEQEMFEQFDPKRHQNEEMLNKSAVYLTDLNKYRNEKDNISVIVVRTQ